MCVVKVYRPPNANVDQFVDALVVVLDSVQRRFEHVFVCGDINVCFKDPAERAHIELAMQQFHLRQCIGQITHKRRLIDVVFAPDVLTVSDSLLPPIEQHHATTAIEFDMDTTGHRYDAQRQQQPKRRWFYSRADWQRFSDILFGQNLPAQVSAAPSVDAAWAVLRDGIQSAAEHAIPTGTSARSKRDAEWITGDLRRLLRKKARLHRIWKRSGSVGDFAAYSALRKSCKKAVAAAKLAFFERVFVQSRNWGSFYTHVKELKGGNPRAIPAFHLPDGSVIAGDEAKANLLQSQFSRVWNAGDKRVPDFHSDVFFANVPV